MGLQAIRRGLILDISPFVLNRGMSLLSSASHHVPCYIRLQS